MTSQNFDARYQLLKCVAVADGIRTHNALELVTGRVVMVHLVDAAGPEEVDLLQRQLGRLPQTEKARVLEIATLPAGFAVVTEFLQGMTNFPEWLAARVPDDSIALPSQIPPGASQFPALRNAEPAAAPDASADSPLRDSFGAGPVIAAAQEVSTVQLRRPETTKEAAPTLTPAGVPPEPIAPVSPPPAPPTPEPPQAAPASAPQGDFTRMFGAQTAAPVPTAPVAIPQTPVPSPHAAIPVEPASAAAPPLMALPITPLPEPRAASLVPAAPVTPVAAPPAAPAPPVLREGEFTRMFRGGSPDPTPPASPAPKIENIPSPFAGGPPPSAPVPPTPSAAAPAVIVPHTPSPPAHIPPPPPQSPRAAGGSDDFFGAFPPVSSLPLAAVPYAPPPQKVPSSPSPIGGSQRPAGLGASPLGGPPAAPAGQTPSGLPPLTPPPAAASPVGGSPLGLSGLPPLPPPPVSAPMFPGGGGGAVSPLGAGRATPASQGGVYTEMIQRSDTPPPVPVVEKKPAQEAPVKKKSIPLGLILVLNGVLILAIVLIAYFVFRPTGVPAGQADSTSADSSAAPDSGGTSASRLPTAQTIAKPTVPTVQQPTLPTVPK